MVKFALFDRQSEEATFLTSKDILVILDIQIMTRWNFHWKSNASQNQLGVQADFGTHENMMALNIKNKFAEKTQYHSNTLEYLYKALIKQYFWCIAQEKGFRRRDDKNMLEPQFAFKAMCFTECGTASRYNSTLKTFLVSQKISKCKTVPFELSA